MDARSRLNQALKAYGNGEIELAERLVREVLADDPKNLNALFALGMIAEARGDTAQAIRHMTEAYQQDSRFTPAIERLAFLSFQIGDFSAATSWTTRCLAVDPTNGPCLALHGRCLAHLGLPAEALGALRKTAQRLNTAAAHLELAEMCAAFNQTDESLRAAQDALERDPDSLAANLATARALTELGRLDETEWFWARVEKAEQQRGQARLAKALTLALSGNLKQAHQAAHEAIERDPKRGKPYYVLFQTRRATKEDEPIVDRMEALLDDPAVRRSDRVDLLYALGKAQDDLGRYEQALGWFDRANAELRELNHPGYTFDREAFVREIDARIAMFPMKQDSWNEERRSIPIFVVGMIRSGTTLVDQILSAHPRVSSAGEQPFLLQHEAQAIEQWKDGGAGKLYDRYLSLLNLVTRGAYYAVDKNPANVLLAGMLYTVFPQRPIVCTSRHAVDTALSIWTTQMGTSAPFVGDRSDIVFAYKQFLRLVEHWQNTIPADSFRVFRYEDLVQDPEGQTRELLKFCRLPWNDACLHPENNHRTIQTPSFWQARQPIYRSSVDRWRRYEPWLGPFSELIGR